MPSYSTHWMGPNTTPRCDPWFLATSNKIQSMVDPSSEPHQASGRPSAPVAPGHLVATPSRPALKAPGPRTDPSKRG